MAGDLTKDAQCWQETRPGPRRRKTLVENNAYLELHQALRTSAYVPLRPPLTNSKRSKRPKRPTPGECQETPHCLSCLFSSLVQVLSSREALEN
jgi:hypothetical protein